MFRAASYHTIDDKGRIVIPSRFREIIREDGGDGVMVSGMDECLLAYSFSGWSILENKIKQLAEKNEYMRRFRRMFIGNASECFCDKQDRILIPPTLREYAELTRDIVLTGVTDHFEIWNRERWEREKQIWREDQRNAEARNEIAKLGI